MNWIPNKELVIPERAINFTSAKYNRETAWLSLLICTKQSRFFFPNKAVCARVDVAELARLWKWTKPTVKRCLKGFEESGFISLYKYKSGNSYIKFNKWVLFNGRMD